MFYNRLAELAAFKQALSSERQQFIVVYGRRRCGKSTLLQHALGSAVIYHQAVEGEAALQRSLLARTIATRFPGFDLGVYPDWDAFFRALVGRGGERYTLALDEFPYLVESDRSLASVLQNVLEDRGALPFDLVVCGSSQRMMERTVLSASAPLYGRADQILKVEPLLAGYLAEHLQSSTPAEVITEFSIWGGVPRYWELRSNYGSLREAITDLLLRPVSLLRDEPRRLLTDDVSQVAQPLSILTLIAGGSNRISELGGRLGKPAADLARPLNQLINLGYVRRERPYGEALRKGNRTLYGIADPFLRFFNRFIVPNASLIGEGRAELVYGEIVGALPGFIGPQWESLCRSAVARGSLGEQFGACERWWGRTADGKQVEVDGVARSRDGTELLLLECTWSDLGDGQRLHARLRELAPTLPFYRGEQVRTAVAARSLATESAGTHLLPKDILEALR